MSNSNTLRSRYAVLLTLFLIPTLYGAFHSPVRYEEAETLLYAKQFADPDFLPADWYFNHPQPVRRPYHVLVFPLTKLFPLPVVSVLARSLGYLLIAVALAAIAVRLRIDAVKACVIIGAFMWLDQSLMPGTEWIFEKTESKVFAYGLIFFALGALMDGRLRLSALLAGGATTMHIIVGGWGTLALGLTVLTQRMGTWKERLQALAMWSLGASAALFFVAAKLWEPHASPDFEHDAVYVYFRMPQHIDPLYWDWLGEDIWVTLVGVLLIGLLLRAARSGRIGSPSNLVAQFTLWTLAPYLCGLLALLFPFAATFLHYYPFRVASTLVLLFGLMIGVPVVLRFVFRETARRWIATAAALYFLWIAAGNFLGDLEELRVLPSGGKWRSVSETKRLRAACQWIRDNTEAGALLISSPFVDVVPYHCQRPVVVMYRMAPSDAAGLEEWYRRLIDFNGGNTPSNRGYQAAREIHRNFGRLSVETYRALAGKYQGSYLLVRERDNLPLPRLFNNGTWTVYSLARAEPFKASSP